MGYELNIAQVTPARAWDWTPQDQRFVARHFAKVNFGDIMEVEAIARARIIQENMNADGPGPGKPGFYLCALSVWRNMGESVDMNKTA